MVSQKQQACPYRLMVVNLSVVAEPQEGKLLNAQRLHSIQLVHNSQPVEAKTAVGEAVDIFKSKGIRAPVCDLHGTGALNGQALITAKQSPDTTHFTAEGHRERRRERHTLTVLISTQRNILQNNYNLKS